MESFGKLIEKTRLIAILRGIPSDDLCHVLDILSDNGIRLAEITFDNSGLYPAEKTAADIKCAVTHMSGKMRVGAGTVTTARELMLASGAGAEFIISPNTDPLIIGQTKQFGMISIPGAFTPSEVVTATQAGADYVKLFPVSSLGPEYVKSILAPLNCVKLLAVGGVSREDTGKYLDAGCVGFGVGGRIANRKLCEEKRFDEIAINAKLWADAAGTGEKIVTDLNLPERGRIIITIDGGTTNTRISLVSGKTIRDRIKTRVGARDSLDGTPLRETVRDGIKELLERNRLSKDDIAAVALSGMIGSESGLKEIPHIPAPAGKDELRRAAVRADMPEITGIPMYFIPGVRTFGTDAFTQNMSAAEICRSATDCDIMRGEETELVGITEALPSVIGENTTVILPGSHMKLIRTDSDGRITGFRTSISGELIRAIAESTILSHSIGDAFPGKADVEWLREGFDFAGRNGLGCALFKIRVMANFAGADHEKLYAFLTGAVLREDVLAAAESERVVVGGSDPFRSAIACLLEGRCEVTALDDRLAEECSAVGAEAVICR